MLERFERFTSSISQISEYWNKLASEEMKNYNLKGPHVTYLICLYRHPGGVTSAGLSKLCHRDKAEVSRSVSLLEKKELIRREYINGNSYKALIKLTDKGRTSAINLCERASLAVTFAGEGLSDEKREIFYNALETIASNLHNLSNDGLPDNKI